MATVTLEYTSDSSSTSDTNSFFEDLISEQQDLSSIRGPDSCSEQESLHYRQSLKKLGAEVFIRQTVLNGTISARKLCTAFGVQPYVFDEDQACHTFLKYLIAREVAKRYRLREYRTIDHAVDLLKKSQKILVITGAGISTSLGIPDFRSKDTGFYAMLRNLGFNEPEDLFNIDNFDDDPSSIMPDFEKVKGSPTHEFIRMLQEKDKLLRNYTQNIDNIETAAGIEHKNVVHCHGSWATATCRKCGHKVQGVEIYDAVQKKNVPRCQVCIKTLLGASLSKKRKKKKNDAKPRKRRQDFMEDSDSSSYDIPEPGVMKPDITFFGEKLADSFFEKIENEDAKAADLLIVIGTSMKVRPVSAIPRLLSHKVPLVYISREPITHMEFDINLIGECDLIVAELCRRARWELRHKMNQPTADIAVKPLGKDDNIFSVGIAET